MTEDGKQVARREKILSRLTASGKATQDAPSLLARLFGAREAGESLHLSADQVASLTKILQNFSAREEELQDELGELREHAFVLGKRLRKVDAGLVALLRRRLLAGEEAADAEGIEDRRFGIWSQNEEDGYIVALLRAAGAPTRTFVEFGSGRSGGNSGLLAVAARWRGLMVEADPESAHFTQRRFGATGRVKVVNTFVTPDNADSLIEDAGLGPEVDFLSIDIDSFDYWVLAALQRCKGRVLSIEYNFRFGAEARVTVPADAGDTLDRKAGYYGTSLAAVCALAESRGYRLVAGDASGTNAFFVRQDLAQQLPRRSPAEVFAVPPEREDSLWGQAFLDDLAARGLPLAEV